MQYVIVGIILVIVFISGERFGSHMQMKADYRVMNEIMEKQREVRHALLKDVEECKK